MVFGAHGPLFEEQHMIVAKRTSLAMSFFLLSGLLAPAVHAQDEQAARMTAALTAPARPMEEKERDPARKPIQTVQFLGIETGDTVIDAIAAGGWFTEVLAAAVGPSGKVLAQNPQFFVSQPGFVEREKARHDRLGNVQAVHGELAAAGVVAQADAAITALNLHDLYNGQNGEATAVAFAKSIYDALKPGGVFGVIDHVGIEGQNNAQFHRLQVAQARDVLTQAGFRIEAESDILRNPGDDHTKPVRDMAGRTDQFLIRARKP
jgi:predicted methyltransferase